MGVEFELWDLKNKRRFELGKRHHAEMFTKWDLDVLRAMGREAFINEADRLWNLPEANTVKGPYRDTPARTWEFCESADWNIRVWSDAEGWDAETIAALKWPEIGSVYTPYWNPG